MLNNMQFLLLLAMCGSIQMQTTEDMTSTATMELKTTVLSTEAATPALDGSSAVADTTNVFPMTTPPISNTILSTTTTNPHRLPSSGSQFMERLPTNTCLKKVSSVSAASSLKECAPRCLGISNSCKGFSYDEASKSCSLSDSDEVLFCSGGNVMTYMIYLPHDTSRVVCPDGYLLNPYSETCLRRVEEKKSWSDAKQYCASNGEYLATFTTKESREWFMSLQQTDTGAPCLPSFMYAGVEYTTCAAANYHRPWCYTTTAGAWENCVGWSEELWVGGYRDNGVWQWMGPEPKAIVASDALWSGTEGQELCAWTTSIKNYTLSDATCTTTLSFVCEKFN